MVAAQWGDHCGRGRRGDYISDSAGLPGRRLQATSQERSTLGCIHRTNMDWQRPVGGLAVMRAAPDLLCVMHWLTQWVRTAKGSAFFTEACGKLELISKGWKAPLIRKCWPAYVNFAQNKWEIFLFFLCTVRKQRDVGGQAEIPDSLSSWKRLITCLLTSSVHHSQTHFPAGPRASDQSRTYLFRRGRQDRSKTTWCNNKLPLSWLFRLELCCCCYFWLFFSYP